MKTTFCAALMVLLPAFATAAPTTGRSVTSTDNAGVYVPKDLGCGGGTPVLGAMIGFGALARRRRRS